MTLWIYKRVTFIITELSTEPFEEQLSALGREGWELVAAVPHEKHGYSQDVHFIFKRAA